MFKIESKLPAYETAVRFGHSYFGHLNLFRASILEFRICASLEMEQI